MTLSIPLELASNLRDLGGVPSTLGGQVKRGLIFRAPALLQLSDADKAVVAQLGLRSICDFRGVQERARSPVAIDGAQHFHLPIEPSVGAGLKDILRTGEASGHMTPSDMLNLLAEAYRDYALQNYGQYRALFGHILRDDGLPLLLHCTAGKDRTGFGSALILRALGVAWDDVMADYLATNDLWRREYTGALDLPPDLKDILLGAHEILLTEAFRAIDTAYGSLDAYFRDALGLDDAARTRLVALLVG